MIPKIDYQIHDVLTNVFLLPLADKKEFEKDAKKFIKNFKKIEKDILVLIERFSGFKWTKRKIPVYLIPNGKSFSFTKGHLEEEKPGVVQKIHGTTERSIQIFIHELAHVNQFQSEFHSVNNKFAFNKNGHFNNLGREICADVVCIQVIRELFGKNSKCEKDYWYFLKKVMISTPEKGKEIPKYIKKWNLNKKTLKEYILNDKKS